MQCSSPATHRLYFIAVSMNLWEQTADFLRDFWPHVLAGGGFLFEAGCALHAILKKRDTRATISWMGLIWLTPLIGAVLYVLFGVNRISRRAKKMRRRRNYVKSASTHAATTPLQIADQLGHANARYQPLVNLVGKLAEQPLLSGNTIEPLIDGDQAYPAMLQAIEQAEISVSLSSFIFDNDAAGTEFVSALIRARERGVEVRVLIDDVGSRYSWPTVVGPLRRGGVTVGRFIRTLWPAGFAYSNLRSHRKILVVDGRIGFTGGMNIRAGTWRKLKAKHPLHDLHFRLSGPVVAQLQETMAEDWAFTTREVLEGPKWFPELSPTGDMLARGVPNGPDEDIGELRSTLIAAIGTAQHRVGILTPYFLPDDALIEALNIAALRGVRVDILLPGVNNQRMVHWACKAVLPQVLERGVRVWYVPGIFDHSKMMIVDDLWSFIGSSNWDPRSLRLNFEFNVECYDVDFASRLWQLIDQRLANAIPVTLESLRQQWFLTKVRNGIARLFTPML